MRSVNLVLPESHIRHRESFKEFVLRDAEPWHRISLGRLYEHWESCNARFFGGQMIIPYLLLSAPGFSQALGDCSEVSAFGGRSQIRLRESLLTGRHRLVRGGEEYSDGRFRFVADVLLHEMIHQWQHEVTGKKEASYKGHGAGFRDKANEIGKELGLAPVRIAKARGKERDLPSCAEWPHCVRPAEYYLGAVGMTESEGEIEESKGGALRALAARAKKYWQACATGCGVEEAQESLCAAARAYGEQR